MRARTLIAIGVAVFLLVVITQLPATLITGRLPPTVQLEGGYGSVFSGGADSVIANGVALGPIEWSFRPLALLKLEFGLHLLLAGPPLQAEGDIGINPLGTLTLGHVKLHAPLATLIAAARIRELPAATATVDAELGSGRLVQGWPVALDGWVRLSDLVVNLTPIPLGSYALKFDALSAAKAPAGGLAARLNDTAAPVRLNALLSLSPDRTYHLDGTLGAAADAPPALASFLAALGPPDGAGLRPFAVSGAL